MSKTEVLRLAAETEESVLSLIDAMQWFYNNEAESWQDGDAGSQWRNDLDHVENALEAIRNVIESMP